MFKFLFTDKITNDFFKTSFGNILEWYDFSIYGLFAIQISHTFFPKDGPTSAILLTLLTFAIGFIARPIGSLIFGYIGDLKGKHYAVNLSIWCMAIPTTIIGLLPGYNVIGFLAPLLLVGLRLMQGLSAGGQFSGLIAIAVDSDTTRKSLLASMTYTISIIGVLLASIIAFASVNLLAKYQNHDNFIASLTWRIPFLLSGLIFSIYIKLRPEYHSHTVDKSNKFSLKEIFQSQPKELVYAILLSATTGTLYYILFSYLVTYMQLHMGFPKITTLFILNLILVLSIILFPIFGYKADQIECKIKQAKKFVWGIGVGAIALFFNQFNVLFTYLGIFIMVTFFCAITGYTTSLFAEIYTKKYRMTACSISFNFGLVVAGFAPFFAEFLTHFQFGFQILILSVVFILLFSLSQLKKTTGYQKSKLGYK